MKYNNCAFNVYIMQQSKQKAVVLETGKKLINRLECSLLASMKNALYQFKVSIRVRVS